MSNNNQQNFYQGQNVLAEDLNNLQAYSDKNRNILISDLLGYGILNGFVVTHKKDLTFSVSPGVAFDGNGNRLILEESTDVVLTKPVYIDGKSEPIKIRIKHSYIGSEPKKDSQDIETLTILTPSVDFIIGETLEENLFQIATITLNEHADPLITRGENFIALPDLTTTVSKNKVEIDKKVDDNTSAIVTTNTAVEKNKTELDSILSKGADGIAYLTGTGFNVKSTDPYKGWKLGSDEASIEFIKYSNNFSSLSFDLLSTVTDNKGVNIDADTIFGNYHSKKQFVIDTGGTFILKTNNDPQGNKTDIDLYPSSGTVNIGGSPIIETGKGSVAGRGTYTKFYDGTLINLALIKYDSGYNGKYIAEFPCAFIDTNYSIDSILLGMKDPSAISKTTSKVEVYEPILPPNWNYSNPSYLGLFVGRWK